MALMIKHYDQPHQLSLQRIAELMEEPSIRASETAGFRRFALRVWALVGMLEQMGEDGHVPRGEVNEEAAPGSLCHLPLPPLLSKGRSPIIDGLCSGWSMSW